MDQLRILSNQKYDQGKFEKIRKYRARFWWWPPFAILQMRIH